MFLTHGKIISNLEVNPGHFLMEINAPSIAKNAKAGQFVTIRCDDATSPLLRRPFSFHMISGSSFGVLYEVLGSGTRILANKKSGEKIDILGPLGNGFTVPKRCSIFILVAGGMGVAPLVALAEKLVHGRRSIVHREPLVLIGARAKNGILCEAEFKKLGCDVRVSTDDGSRGFKGTVTDLLKNLLSTMDYRLRTIYACGPEPMLKGVAHIARKRGLECYASLEENIACGVGACLGCTVKTKLGYKLVCKDGPVFNLNEIIW